MTVALLIAMAVLLVGLKLAELRWPARTFPQVPGWRVTGAVFLAIVVPASGSVAFLLPPDWLNRHALLHLDALSGVSEFAIGFLASTFAYYWLHRAQHHFHWFWRSGHQLHHAIQRIDLTATAVLHPTDLVLQIAVSIVVCAFVLGLSPEVTALVSTLSSACGFFQHVNLKTPRWLALVCQRPEAHCRHHEIGVHSYNFGDFPLWDVLFGTFSNPRDWQGEAGFGSAPRIADLMLMRDVSGPPAQAPR
jgi:sterol desaturase/sphingolipid hydroxylase (fatty acid hydroxylase superfamily)